MCLEPLNSPLRGPGSMDTEVPAVTPVLDLEKLFRAVRDSPQLFGCEVNGTLKRLSHSVFNDPGREPSVDRAGLRQGGPADSRKSDSDGVVPLVACDVRAIKSVVSYDEKKRPVSHHFVNVEHDPLPDNHSHALVKTAPQLAGDGAFKRLKEALCRIAEHHGWAFKPGSLRG